MFLIVKIATIGRAEPDAGRAEPNAGQAGVAVDAGRAGVAGVTIRGRDVAILSKHFHPQFTL